MCIILRNPAHARHPAEFPGFSRAVDVSKLRKPNRQIAIAMLVTGVDANVMRAVHRLEKVAVDVPLLHPAGQLGAAAVFLGEHIVKLAIDDRRKLALAIIRKMPARLVKLEPPNMRRKHLLISLPPQMLADKLLQLQPHLRPLRLPQHKALPNLLIDGEEPELRAEHAMIALLRLVQLLEMLIKLLLIE